MNRRCANGPCSGAEGVCWGFLVKTRGRGPLLSAALTFPSPPVGNEPLTPLVGLCDKSGTLRYASGNPFLFTTLSLSLYPSLSLPFISCAPLLPAQSPWASTTFHRFSPLDFHFPPSLFQHSLCRLGDVCFPPFSFFPRSLTHSLTPLSPLFLFLRPPSAI